MARARPTDSIDYEIVALAAARDIRGAAALLAKAYLKFLRDYVRARVRPGAVDDICGEVWAVVSRKVPADLASPRGYLIAIARNKVGHALNEHSFQALDASVAALSTSPPSKLGRAQKAEELRAAVAALDPYDRELLHLSFHENMKPSEIAVAMGRGELPKTVSKQITRAIDKLRDHVKW
jgi:RNA polymerase sigma factor (sigma-70 family)